MQPISSHPFPRKNIDATVAAAAGFFIIWLYTRHSGIGVSPDSVVYTSVARNIRDRGALVDFNTKPLVMFPAGYPFFLSMVMLVTGKDPLVFAPLLNGLLFAVVIYTSGWIMERFSIRSKWHKHLVLSCIALSPCLLEVYSMLWSETLFIFLLLLFIASLRNYLNTYTLFSLLIAGAIAAFACITRYAGVTLIATGGILILLDKRLEWQKKIRHLLIFSFTATSLLVVNLVRNTLSDGTGTGMREKSLTSFTNNIFYYGNVLCDWLPIPEGHFGLAVGTGLIFLAALSALLWFSFRKRHLYTPENIATAFSLVYSLFIILSATFSRYELINSRLLAPLFIPVLWSVTAPFSKLISASAGKKRILITVICCLLFAVFQFSQYTTNYENYDGIKDAGIPGYTEDPWQKHSELVNFIRKDSSIFTAGFTIYSNADDAIYFFTGRRCEMVPHKVFPREINGFYQEKNCCVVWFNDAENPELIGLDDILAHKNMTLLYQFTNGFVYVTNDRPPPLPAK